MDIDYIKESNVFKYIKYNGNHRKLQYEFKYKNTRTGFSKAKNLYNDDIFNIQIINTKNNDSDLNIEDTTNSTGRELGAFRKQRKNNIINKKNTVNAIKETKTEIQKAEKQIKEAMVKKEVAEKQMQEAEEQMQKAKEQMQEAKEIIQKEENKMKEAQNNIEYKKFLISQWEESLLSSSESTF